MSEKQMSYHLAWVCLHAAFTCSLNPLNRPMQVSVFIILQIKKLSLRKGRHHPLISHRDPTCQSQGWKPSFISGCSAKAALAKMVLGFQEQSELQALSLLELSPAHRGLFLGH